MLSDGAIHFEDRFCASRKVGRGEVGGYTTLADSAYMAAVAGGYRKGLVSAGWSVLLPSCTNKHRKRSFHLVGTISGLLDNFQFGGEFSGRRALTIEHSVMCGYGQGNKPVKNF